MILSLTAAPAAAFDFDSIKSMLDGVNPEALLPKISGITGFVTTICRLAILAAPIVLFALGMGYLLFAPKEANYYFGYRTVFGMGSVSAWRRTQKLAGFVFAGVGAVLTVVMLMISATLGGMENMAMVGRAVKCLIWEGVIAIAAIAFINGLTAMTFDYNGNRRKQK